MEIRDVDEAACPLNIFGDCGQDAMPVGEELGVISHAAHRPLSVASAFEKAARGAKG